MVLECYESHNGTFSSGIECDDFAIFILFSCILRKIMTIEENCLTFLFPHIVYDLFFLYRFSKISLLS